MQDYFYIRENLHTFKIEEKLSKLSKEYKNKKVAILGANSAFKAICEKFNLEEMFNIVGISDGNVKNIESIEDEYKIIPFENLYFSGIDLLINLKDDGHKIEKYLRRKNFIKKRVKFVNLMEKSFFEKFVDYMFLLKKAFFTARKISQIGPVINDLFNYDTDVVKSRFNYREKVYDLIQNKQEPIRVLFVVFDYKYWVLNNNLYYKMRSDNDFKILPILVLPNVLSENEYSSTHETLEYLKENGYNCLDGIDHESDKAVILKALKPDIIIYQQSDYLKADYNPSLLSEYALTCYVESDFAYTTKNKIDRFLLNRLVNTWKLYISNKESYKPLKNTVDTGLLSFEKYHNNPNSENINLWKDSEKDDCNRILYCPSCEIDEKFNKLNFFEIKQAMLEYARSNPHYSFVLMPDKNFKKKCIDNNIFTEEEFNGYINNWNELFNVTVSDVTNSVLAYNTSDILITDGLSSAFEYFPYGKPIVLFGQDTVKHLNFIGSKIFKTFYKLQFIANLDSLLADLLISKNDYNSQERFSILGKYNEYFNRETSDLIINDIKISLGRIESEVEQSNSN